MNNLFRHAGSAAELHARDPFDRDLDEPLDEHRVWWCDFDSAALVLGSRQDLSAVNVAATGAAGIDVTVRRSGGGAVLMRPDDVIWVDVLLPAGRFTDDIRASMIAVGGWWCEAIRTVAGEWFDRHGEPIVHTGPMIETAWSPLVCFDGVGPGEALVGGRKLVGLSQRRTRAGARIQGLVHRHSLVAETATYLHPAPPAPIADSPAIPALTPFELATAISAALSA